MLIDTLSEIRVAGRTGRPRSRPGRLLADKGYPSKANRAWLRARDIATTIPERDDQIAHRRKKPGRPIARRGAAGAIQGSQRRRALFQQAQAMARDRDALRQDRPQLPRSTLPRRAPPM